MTTTHCHEELIDGKLSRSVLKAGKREQSFLPSHQNSLHWVLDVTFQEDTSRVRDQHARRNLALLRKIAINLIHQSATTGSVRGRRKQAAWDNAFMAQLLL